MKKMFQHFFASGGRVLAQAAPERRLDVFRLLAGEAATWANTGTAKLDIVDELAALADEAGLDVDGAQAAMADAYRLAETRRAA